MNFGQIFSTTQQKVVDCRATLCNKKLGCKQSAANITALLTQSKLNNIGLQVNLQTVFFCKFAKNVSFLYCHVEN